MTNKYQYKNLFLIFLYCKPTHCMPCIMWRVEIPYCVCCTLPLIGWFGRKHCRQFDALKYKVRTVQKLQWHVLFKSSCCAKRSNTMKVKLMVMAENHKNHPGKNTTWISDNHKEKYQKTLCIVHGSNPPSHCCQQACRCHRACRPAEPAALPWWSST